MKTFFTILQKILNTRTIVHPGFNKTFSLENSIWSNYYKNEDRSNVYLFHIYNFMNYLERTPVNEKNLLELIKLKYKKMIDLKENVFLPKINNELFEIFAKAQRIYNGFNILARIFRSKKKLQPQYDLLLNELDPKNKTTIKLYHNNWIYLFSVKDLINLINTSLSNCDHYYADPKSIKNPYNNIDFTKANLYNIYFKIKSLDYIMPILFHQYFVCDFNIERFEIENESLIRDKNIHNIVFKSNSEMLFKEISQMLEISKGDGYKIQKEIKDINLVDFLNITRPYYYLYLISNYYVEGTEKKRRSKNLFNRKIHELFYYNPKFARLSIKRKMLEKSYNKVVNLDAPKFTMKEVYEYKNILEQDTDSDSDSDTENETEYNNILDSQNTRLPMHRLFQPNQTEQIINMVDNLFLSNY